MQLNEIYKPINKELGKVEDILKSCLYESQSQSILKINRFLFKSPGKRIRPALVILSAKAALGQQTKVSRNNLIKIASAIELIHMASLIHDDVVDHSKLRHNKPTVNFKWGQDVSIALGDYLYSLAFKLISKCGNADILDCISSAAKMMCSGELIQIVERDNLSLLKNRYLLIIKKKTAALFAASCQAGALVADSSKSIQSALKGYGLNFGIAFQIADDYLDLTGEQERLGKIPGQDLSVGEITLPILNLLDCVDKNERENLIRLFKSKPKDYLGNIKNRFLNSRAMLPTKRTALSYLNTAKKKLNILPYSDYRKSLFDLADLISRKSFSDNLREEN